MSINPLGKHKLRAHATGGETYASIPQFNELEYRQASNVGNATRKFFIVQT